MGKKKKEKVKSTRQLLPDYDVKYLEEYLDSKGFDVYDNNRMDRCPDPNCKTESSDVCEIYNDGQIHCFRCHFHGSLPNVIAVIEGMPFGRAVAKANQIAGIKGNALDQAKFERQILLEDILAAFVDLAAEKIHEAPHVMSYLKDERGISDEAIKKWRLGYLPKNFDVIGALHEKGFKKVDIKVVFGSEVYEDKGEISGSYCNRIIMPDEKYERTVYFAARAMGDEKPKYSKLVATHFFNNVHFYGEKFLTKKGWLVTTEGYFDALLGIENGFDVVALGTTHVNKDQHTAYIRLCRQHDGVILVFDSELTERGEKSARKIGQMLFDKGIKVKFVRLPIPEGETKVDLADYFLTHSPEDFQKLIDETLGWVKFNIVDMIEKDGLHKLDQLDFIDNFNSSPLYEFIRSLSIEHQKASLRFVEEKMNFKQGALGDLGEKIEKDLGDDDFKGLKPPMLRELFEAFMRKVGKKIILKGGAHYKFTGTHFVKASKDELKFEIARWLDAFPQLHAYAVGKYVNDIMLFYNANNYIYNKKIKIPFYISTEEEIRNHYVSFKNGLLDITKFIDDLKGDISNFDKVIASSELIEHSDDLFIISSAPFDFEPTEKPALGLKVLEGILADKDELRLTLQWWGYNLVPMTDFNTMFMGIGEGENGKSVWATMMKCIIGEENVGHVKMEGFDPKRLFQIETLVDKLANITEEIGKLPPGGEETLKAISGGTPTPVEAKGEKPYSTVIPARLTWMGNNPPVLTDRTKGTWRRLNGLHFQKEISKEDRIRKYLLPAFWIDSGELPGLFNLALRGLADLLISGDFVVPKATTAMLEEFRLEANPAKAWIPENLEKSEGVNISGQEVYTVYVEAMSLQGRKPLSQPQFYKEIHRVFPHTKKPNKTIVVESSGFDGLGKPGKVVKARGFTDLRWIKEEDEENAEKEAANTES